MTTSPKRRFVLAFIFNSTTKRVLLIHKNRPENQKGRINGLGGKIETGESALGAVKREIWEEAGLTITDWTTVGTMKGPDWHIDVFTYIYEGKESDAHSITDEQVRWYPVSKLPSTVLFNIYWLLPLCLDIRTKRHIHKASINYR